MFMDSHTYLVLIKSNFLFWFSWMYCLMCVLSVWIKEKILPVMGRPLWMGFVIQESKQEITSCFPF